MQVWLIYKRDLNETPQIWLDHSLSWLLCECVLRSCRVIWSCRGPLASLTCIQEEHKEEMNKLEHKLTLLEMPTKSLPTDIKPNISDPCYARYYNQLRPLNKMSGAVLYYIWASCSKSHLIGYFYVYAHDSSKIISNDLSHQIYFGEQLQKFGSDWTLLVLPIIKNIIYHYHLIFQALCIPLSCFLLIPHVLYLKIRDSV